MKHDYFYSRVNFCFFEGFNYIIAIINKIRVKINNFYCKYKLNKLNCLFWQEFHLNLYVYVYILYNILVYKTWIGNIWCYILLYIANKIYY